MQLRKTVCATAVLFLVAFTIDAAPKKKYNAAATKKLLAAAVENRDDDTIAALKAGADPNAADPERSGRTALMAAAGAGRTASLEQLLAAGANINAKDKDGWTALMYAAVGGEWQTLEPLIAKKADLEATDKDGYTAFTMALVQGKGGIAERLIKAGANTTKPTAKGYTPLIIATTGRDLKSVRLVLEHTKADVNGRDDEGWTPLEMAAYYGDSQVAMDLLRHGADPSLKDKEGKTALDRAKELEHKEMIALLTGKWDRPKATGTKVSIPCQALGGNVDAFVAVDGDALVVTTIYPKPLNYYLGGGFVNRANSASKYTYEGFVAPTYTFGGYTLDYMEYGTTVSITDHDSEGNATQRGVYGLTMSADLKKGDESVDTSELDWESTPRASLEDGVLRTRIPLSLVKLKKGAKVKLTAKVGNCAEVASQVALK
ncbi:MAG TPA: ankyrin repeat domain-containing protein [Thermoanaerobaculia bacterium]